MSSDPAIDQHSAAVKKCEGSIRTGIRVCRAQSVVSGSTLRIGSRHFSQSVFLHVKWPARNLSIVREVRSVREREGDTEREKDGSDVTIVALKLAMNFALLLAKNVHLRRRVLRFSLPKNLHLSFSLLEWRWVHTFRCQKRCTFRNSSHSSHCQMTWLTGDRSSKANDRISGCTVLLSRRKNRKNESN